MRHDSSSDRLLARRNSIPRKNLALMLWMAALLIALAASPCMAQLTDVQHPNEQTRSDEVQKNATQSPTGAPPWVATGQETMQEIASSQFGKVEAQYDPKLASAAPSGRLAEAWGSVVKQEGSFQAVVGARAGKVQNLNVVLFTCKFQKGLVDAEFAFRDDGKIAAIHFGPHREPQPSWQAPSYADKDSFTETPLNLVNGAFEMPGTLTVPEGDGPFPAVVLLQDSGPHDEDETIGPNKPLKDLAWGLASHGVAVYRYMKRTQKYGAKSNADPAKLTVNDEVISDARAAVELVAKQSRIDPKRVYVAGLSLGGYLAPRIASGDPRIVGIVMLAANTRPLEKVLLGAVKYIAKEDAAQTAEAADKPSLASNATATAAAKPTPKPSAGDEQTVALVENSVKQIESPSLKPGDEVTVLGGKMDASYWLDLRNYNPVKTAEALEIPMLILQGGRDFQVTPADDFSTWQSALGRRRNVTLKLYPDLNHLFMFGTGPSMPAEYSKRGHVDQQVVIDIAAWIATGGKRPASGSVSN